MYFNIVEEVLAIAKQAGNLINNYTKEHKIKSYLKNDNSLVTEADILANDYIVNSLEKLTPNIKIIAEESKNITLNAEDKNFWLVDPIDGTAGFVKGKKEYTVNIALIENDLPIGGVIYLPAFDITYYVGADGLSYKQEKQNIAQKIKVRNTPIHGATIVSSMHHKDGKTDKYIKSLSGIDKIISVPSSLKFCLIAEGVADIYPRFGQTMEWDTAAGHAILQSAGGVVTTMDKQVFTYKKTNFINGPFLALGADNNLFTNKR